MRGNAAVIVLVIIVVLVVLGAVFAYKKNSLSFLPGNNQAPYMANSNSQIDTESQALDQSLNTLGQDTTAVDQSMADNPGDLSNI
jgi:hypothetical protein